MPELPEVETVCRGLSKEILGNTFTMAANLRPNLRIPFPENFSSLIEGKKIKSIKRRSKYILINLDDSTTMIVHLGMSGKLVIYNNFQNSRQKHDHAVFRFDNNKEMVFNDPRRFGLITISNTNSLEQNALIANLGPEPLEDGFNGDVLYDILQKKSSPIKTTIMDASILVGVGNIYACESLFRSKILPTRKANSLTKKECISLAENIKKVLSEAIDSGGSTLRDYIQSSGDSGYFQHKFLVYGKDGTSCSICKNKIERLKQSGRSTFYCPTCQK